MNPLLLFIISLCWDPSPDTSVTKYRVYVDGIYRDSIDAPVTRATVGGLEPGRVYGFTVTAQNAEGLESDPSNELRYVMPVMSIRADTKMVYFQIPLEDRRANVEYFLESTSDFQTWRNENYIIQGESGSASFATEPYRFYRVRMNIRREGCAQ